MQSVRFGIVGLGLIGKQHAESLLAGKAARATLAAVASSSAEKLAAFAARGVKTFPNAGAMIHSGAIDALLIATPHTSHLEIARAAFAAGLHVLVEKPLAPHKADAEKLVAAAQKFPRLMFAAMFQKRAEPCFQKMRALLSDGALGKISRVNWITTDWFRSEAYYRSSDWRATWAGEGGGVLLNQALHNLDMMTWLCGQPERVRGFCQFGRFHDIEAEDNATAYLEWAGATGAFITSTGEAPGTNRLEIAGSLGRLVLENNHLTLTRNAVDAQEFSRTAKEAFAKMETRTETIPFDEIAAPHAALMQNFADAILDGAPLLAPGAEGIHSVELANAMVYSSIIGQTVELPLDGAAWEKKLNELIAAAKVAK
jgi:predicted dehydrogenase